MNRFVLAFSLACSFATPVFALAPKVNVSIERWDKKLVVEKNNSLTISESIKMTIYNEGGYDYAVFQDYYDSFRKIRQVKYSIFDVSGKRVRKYTKMDALDLMLNSSYEINDARILVINPDYRQYPFTIEMEVEIVYSSFLDFPVWMPRNSPGVEVKKASLALQVYEGFQFRKMETNGVAKPVVTLAEGLSTFTWTVENLPALSEYVSDKTFLHEQPSVRVTPIVFTLGRTEGTFQSWADFGNWFLDLNKERNKLTEETKTFLATIDVNKTDIRQVVRKVYRHMQSKTRYISIQLGIGGFQTLPADEVERTGYGDCKALTNYMKSMLDYLKIPSHYILVKAGGDVDDVLAEFPSNQFNHVFLGVPSAKDTLWFECTNQDIPPSFTGRFTDDRYVLWISENKSEIVRSPVYPHTRNIKRSVGEVKMKPTGDADVDVTIHQEGVYFEDLFLYKYYPTDKIQQHNFDQFPYKDYNINFFQYTVPDQDVARLHLEYKMKVRNVAKVMGTKMAIPVNVLKPFDMDISTDMANRRAEVLRGFTWEDSVKINIPENFWVDVLPSQIVEKTPFGEYQINISADADRNIFIRRKVIIFKGTFRDERFDQFNATLKKFRALEQTKIVLESKT
jgi:hypothetical protein